MKDIIEGLLEVAGIVRVMRMTTEQPFSLRGEAVQILCMIELIGAAELPFQAVFALKRPNLLIPCIELGHVRSIVSGFPKVEGIVKEAHTDGIWLRVEVPTNDNTWLIYATEVMHTVLEFYNSPLKVGGLCVFHKVILRIPVEMRANDDQWLLSFDLINGHQQYGRLLRLLLTCLTRQMMALLWTSKSLGSMCSDLCSW